MRLSLYAWSALVVATFSRALGPSDELIAMIKSHNNQDGIMTFVTTHPETLNNYVAGYTPLMHAIFERLPDVACRLIVHGADIHLKDQNALANAFMYAVSYDLPEVVQTLINYGAHLNDTDIAGKTVWDYLKQSEVMLKPYAPHIRNMLDQYAARMPLPSQVSNVAR